MPEESPLCAAFGEPGHEQPCAACENRRETIKLGRENDALRQRIRRLEAICGVLVADAQSPQVVADADESDRWRARP